MKRDRTANSEQLSGSFSHIETAITEAIKDQQASMATQLEALKAMIKDKDQSSENIKNMVATQPKE